MKRQSEKWKRWKNSVAVHWVASYLLILLIPIFTTLFSSRHVGKIMVAEIEKANQAVLSSLKADMDQQLENAHAAFSFIFQNGNFSNTTRRRGDSLDFRTDGAAFMKALQAYCSSTDTGEVLVYWTENDYLLLGGSFTKSAQLFGARQMHVSDGLTQAEWLSLLGESYNNQFLISPAFSIRSSKNSIVYAHSVENRACGRVNVFVHIPLSAIQEISKRLEGSILLLLDGNGAVLTAAYGGREIPDLELPVLSGGEAQRISLDGESYIFTDIPSNQSSWSYAILAPEKVFWESSRYAAYLNLLGIAVALLLGGLVSFALFRYNYRPVEILLHMLGKGSGSGNEFERIMKSYSLLREENRNMKGALEEQLQRSRESYLLARLKGRRRLLDNQDANARFDLQADGYFTLIAFSPAENGSKEENGPADSLDLLFFAVDNVFSELMQGACELTRMEDGEVLFYLLRYRSPEGWKERCGEAAQRVVEIFSGHSPVNAAVSPLREGLDSLPLLYRDTMDAMEYRSIAGGSGLLWAQEVQLQELPGPDWRSDNQLLSEALRSGDAAAATAAVNRIFENYHSSTSVSFSMFRLLLVESYTAIAEAFSSISGDSEQCLRLTKQLEQLLSCSQESVLQQELLQIVERICRQQREREGPPDALIQRIEDYVQKNYMDSNLNISTIADAMQLTPSYLSRTFRAKTGEGLLDRLNAIRIAHAKEIMRTRNISQEQLCGMVGYANVRTFRRAFSRAEGVTPGKYFSGED